MPLKRHGSSFVTEQGYRSVVRGGKRGLEHRFVMEDIIGRPLLSTETVHHRNGDRLDNRRKNLELWATGHPYGQRAEDLVEYAVEILQRYSPGALA